MKRLEYHPQTRVESKEAVDWYRSRSRTAALEFRDELKSALARLRKNPLAGSPYIYGTRRVILDRFPFSLVYRERPHDIQIVAIAHAKRRPGYWTNRLKH